MALSIYGIVASRAVRPLWVASELGLEFTHVPIDFANKGTRVPEFMAVNPNGHIPALVDEREDGERIVVWESMACALYLARHFGKGDGSDISPCSPAEDAQALRWSFWTVNEVEADALTILMHRVFMPVERRKPELADAAERRLATPLGVLERELVALKERHSEPYLAGARFTVADICVASVLNWTRGSHVLMEENPNVKEWLHRCLARPAHKGLR